MSWMGKSVRRVEDERLLKGLALLLGDRMVEVLSREVERMANDPMPLRERKKRIAEIEVEIGLPPAVVLGFGSRRGALRLGPGAAARRPADRHLLYRIHPS